MDLLSSKKYFLYLELLGGRQSQKTLYRIQAKSLCSLKAPPPSPPQVRACKRGALGGGGRRMLRGWGEEMHV